MGVLILRAFPAKQTEAQVYGAVIANVAAGFASAAFRAPASFADIAGFTFGTMGTLFQRAFHAYVVPLLRGAAVADVGSRAAGTFSAFDAKLYAFIACIAFTAIGGSVDPFLTIAAVVPCVSRQNGSREQTHQHRKDQKRA